MPKIEREIKIKQHCPMGGNVVEEKHTGFFCSLAYDKMTKLERA
jgi:hypothetical protein